MNKRFWIICLVIGLALGVLSVLGLSSLKMHRKGLLAERQQEFMDVAKQISFDVKKKVDDFLLAEQSRPYTDYQLYFVPEYYNPTNERVQSPLANTFFNDLANGYFQLESDGQLVSPYLEQTMGGNRLYFDNVRQNLLPSLANGQVVATHRVEPTEREQDKEYDYEKIAFDTRRGRNSAKNEVRLARQAATPVSREDLQQQSKQVASKKSQQLSKSKGAQTRRSVYPISNKELQQETQVISQRRDTYDLNFANNTGQVAEESASQSSWRNNKAPVSQTAAQRPQQTQPRAEQHSSFGFSQSAEMEAQDAVQRDKRPDVPVRQEQFDKKYDNDMMMDPMMMGADEQTEYQSQPGSVDQQQIAQGDTVQIRIEPFVPITVSAPNGNGIFAGQVFMLRHVQIEDRHLMQGFQLNEDELLTQITQSAKGLLRRGMGYEISKAERSDAKHTAILQFDFGEVVLNLLELEPGYIQARVVYIRNWFFGILGVVWLAVLVAMAALWKNLHEQVVLSRKKDDFISAVSHELRTPLTSIRMYTEMLEKNWVKTDGKRREYYTTMRTESERLTRLIENVLDFSRIQRGKKRYDFTVGDVNACIGDVVDMMRPYIERAGFVLEQQFEVLDAFAFDRDAVTQIVINLLDNALKYAKDTQDKHIIVRTRKQADYAVIEVEDHGPGIARSQQKKIFDAFYRCEDESTRQNTGTGLGLALVKRFAEAHHGFVEIAGAKPHGALFRVALANH
ncbi:MAG: HAMP domain-containing sensor histidine kinase [Planctomycetota bacterium]